MDATFGILGRTALRVDGTVDEHWGRPRLRAMLATLLIHPGKPVPIDTLMAWVWPEDTPTPQNRVQTFHSYATRIRQNLQHVRVPVELAAVAGTYRLSVDHSTIDYYRFRSLIATARTLRAGGEPEAARRTALEAIGLWRGQPLEEMNTERARNWRQRVLANEWLPANTLLLGAELTLEQFDTALSRVDELMVDYPDDLALTKFRITALRGLARFDDALAQYLATYRRLRNDADDQAAEHLRRFFENSEPASRPPATRRADSAVPRQLPHAPVTFVGRETQLAALDVAAGTDEVPPTPGIFVIDGTAGVGKTALAVHWAHRVRHRFPDGDFFVDLHGYSDDATIDSATVVDDFLVALGHPPDTTMPRRARDHQLSRLLAGRRTVVILDNVRNSDHVQDLVGLMSSSLVIVTSRQRLTKLSTATGARTISVEPLDPEDTAALLTIRLGGRRALSSTDHARLAQLSGGLPIMISVLAEHAATRPTTYGAELTRRDVLLDVGDDGDGPITANTLFLPSYRALPVAEQRLFRLLGRHPSPDISIGAASACDGRSPADTKRSLSVLVGAHLLEQSDFPQHYRMHDLLHEFAIHRSESDEMPNERRAAEIRILDHYLASAATADRLLYPSHLTAPNAAHSYAAAALSDPADARSWLQRERANIVSAIRMAAARGHHDHAWRLADAVAAHFDANGHYHDGLIVRELAVASARLAGHREAEGSCLVDLGMAYLILGDHTRARQALQEARRSAEDEHNDRGLACTLYQLGRLEVACGHPASAIDLYEHSLVLSHRINDQEGLCWSHCRIGEALHLAGQPDAALVHLQQAQVLAQQIGAPSAQARSTAAVGSILYDRGEYAPAEAHCRQALRQAEQIPNLTLTAQICTTLATISEARGLPDTAVDYLQRAIALCQQSGNLPDEAQALYTLGDLHAARGSPTDALAVWQRARDLYEHTGNLQRQHLLQARIAATPRPETGPER